MHEVIYFYSTLQKHIMQPELWCHTFPLHGHRNPLWGRGNNIMVSVSVCQARRPGLSPARSVCFRKVELYQHVINLFPLMLTTGSTKAVHVLSCLRDNAHKRSLAICRKSKASCPINRLLSVPIWSHVLNRDIDMIQTNSSSTSILA